MTLQGFEQRIQIEKAIMSKEMPQFKLFHKGSEHYFEGWYSTSTEDGYKLRLVLPAHYPDKKPNLYVVSPRILPKYGEGTINSQPGSHQFHTSPNGPGGCVQICHFSTDTWEASCTAVGVMIRGLLWLEAYSLHSRNGKSIADILEKVKLRQSREKANTCEQRNLYSGYQQRTPFASLYLEKLASKELHSLYLRSKQLEL
jgi:hypothetical protein